MSRRSRENEEDAERRTAALMGFIIILVLAIAGIVIAGFAVGGLIYTLSVSRLLPRLGTASVALIERETAIAASGHPARIILKINALTDHELIQALYRASQAGVRVEPRCAVAHVNIYDP